MWNSIATGEIFLGKRLDFSDFLLYYTITARRSVDTAGFFTSVRKSEKKVKKNLHNWKIVRTFAI
jgi:hypothetical protein